MKSFRIIAAVILVLAGLASCKEEGPAEVFASSVSLDFTSVDIPIGQTINLTATVYPEITTDKTIVWKSSDESIVRVEEGVLYALKIGSAKVTATCGHKSASCTVNVVPIAVTEISLDQTSASLRVDEAVKLTATVGPDNATDKTVIWTSSNEDVATVEDGLVTARAVGTATVTAKAGEKTATCAITVEATPVTGVTLDKTSASLRAGQTVTLTATVNPSDATDKTLTWSTSDATVATVSNGVVTAKKVGTATVTAKAGDKTATCKVTVVATPVTSVTLDKTSASLKAGETVTLTATVNPSDATDKAVTWSTSDASIATVNNGVVTAKKVGTATVTAKAGDKTATCTVTVLPSYSGGHEGTTEEDW